MKKVIILLLSSFVLMLSKAQEAPKYSWYASGEIILESHLGMNLNANFVINEKYSFQAGFSGHMRTGESKPDNFCPGPGDLFTLNILTYDYMRNYQIMGGRIFKLNKRGDARLNLSVGAGLTFVQEPINWQSQGSFPPLGIKLTSNYSYDIHYYSTFSLIVNPKFEFPITRIVGFSLSPMAVINKDRASIGLGLGMMVGLLRSDESASRIKM